MAWFDELGFQGNPLDSRPNHNLIGLEDQFDQLKNHIEKEEVCFLNGLTGSGKTSLLKKMQATLKGHKFMYLDAQDVPNDFDLEAELKNKRGFFDKITLKKFPTKKPVLIIDEFQATDPNLVLEARGKWENANQRRIKSIVIAQISQNLQNVTASFKERIGTRLITTRVLDDDELKDVLKLRLSSKKGSFYNKLSEEAVDLVIHCADGNPRRLLEYTDMLFDFHHRKFSKVNPILHKQDYKISFWAAKEILELNKINVDDYIEKRKHRELKVGRKVKSFKELFTKEEQQLVKYLMTGGKTIENVSTYFSISKSASRSRLAKLKRKEAVVSAGKNKENQKLWRIAPHVKRLSVKV